MESILNNLNYIGGLITLLAFIWGIFAWLKPKEKGKEEQNVTIKNTKSNTTQNAEKIYNIERIEKASFYDKNGTSKILSFFLILIGLAVITFYYTNKPKSFFTKNSKNFKVLILPFNQLCEYNGNSYDAGDVINRRLQNIAKEQNLNIESWWDKNYTSDLLSNDAENEVKRLEKLHHTDMIVFGIVEECESIENQVCVNFHTNEKYKLGGVGSNLNNDFRIGTIADVKQGKLQEDVENIAILISVLSQVNEINYTDYLQKLRKLLKLKNLSSTSREIILAGIAIQLENDGKSKDAFKFYQQLLNDFKNNKRGYYIILSKVGDLNLAKGNINEALKNYKEYNQLAYETYKKDSSNVDFKNELAISYSKLAEINLAKGNLNEALKNYKERNKHSRLLYEQDTSNIDFKNELAISYGNIGEIYRAKGNLEEALKNYKKYSQLTKSIYDQDPENVNFINGFAISYSKLGEIYEKNGDLEKALMNYKEHNRLTQFIYNKDTKNLKFKNYLAISYSQVGGVYRSKGNLEEALKSYNEYNRLKKSLYEQDPSNVNFKNGLAISYAKLAVFYRDNNNNVIKAKEYFKHAEQHLLTLTINSPDYAEFSRNLSNVQKDLKALE